MVPPKEPMRRLPSIDQAAHCNENSFEGYECRNVIPALVEISKSPCPALAAFCSSSGHIIKFQESPSALGPMGAKLVPSLVEIYSFCEIWLAYRVAPLPEHPTTCNSFAGNGCRF